jgi:glycine cleavage system H protein
MTDQIWNGCVVPDDRLYDLDMHVWVRLDGEEAVLGMTDVAQTMGGRLVQVSWKRPGRTLARGRTVAVLESAKFVGPFPTPLSGQLVAVNRLAFDDDIAIGNRDPYGAGWMARVRPTHLRDERSHLHDGAAAYSFYREFIDEREIRCYRCAE